MIQTDGRVETSIESPPQASRRQLMFGDWSRLEAVRGGARNGTVFARGLARLGRDVDAITVEEPWSVTSKSLTPPSGDKRDYCTWSEYFWPDPQQPDGLPWILRDGHINPAATQGSDDANHLRRMANAAHCAALHAWLHHDPATAALATRLIDRWFLNEETAMRPHLRFASLIPGVEQPPTWGLIRAHPLLQVIDATRLLDDCGWWDDERDRLLRTWWSDFLEWTLDSPMWTAELERGNNHTTWCLALGLGLASELQIEGVIDELCARVPSVVVNQITVDGKQSAESARSRGFFYCCYNLEGLALLADLASPTRGDLWAADSPVGDRLRSAIRWLSPFLEQPDRWPAPFLIDWDATVGASALHRIMARCPDMMNLDHMFSSVPHMSRPGLREWLTWDTSVLPKQFQP